MDLRVLRYFLAVAREKSIVKAAETLHVTQPTLSRQLKDLEEELGARLFERGTKNQGIVLTEKGMLLRQRAEELVELADRTETEMRDADGPVRGDILIGGGESEAMRLIAELAEELSSPYPDIHYSLYSGHAEDVKERLDKGLLDFGVFVGCVDLSGYESVKLPVTDRWGLLVRKDDPLAQQDTVTAKDLVGLPLIVSRQEQTERFFEEVAGIQKRQLNIVATYNLVFNAVFFVQEGFGAMLCLDKLVRSDENLKFLPLEPEHPVELSLAWKKYRVFHEAARLFLDELKKRCEAHG